MDNYKNVKQNCGYELARPYINSQVYTDSYDLKTALRRGTLFPEQAMMEDIWCQPLSFTWDQNKQI